MTAALNEELLKGNTCFGCGPDNPDGLRIRIFRDPGSASRLVGTYRPRATRFLTPATLGTELALSSEVVREAASPREPMLIRGAIRDAAGVVLTEIDFEYLLLPQERFMKAVGLKAMPDSYRRHFGEL